VTSLQKFIGEVSKRELLTKDSGVKAIRWSLLRLEIRVPSFVTALCEEIEASPVRNDTI
jgi:hypothetical protein